MDNSRNFVVITILCLTGLLNGQYTTVPRNTAGLSGQSLTLNCAKEVSVTDQVAWREYISKSSGSLVSVDGGVLDGYQSRYNVLSPATGTYNLEVRTLSQAEAGNHQCGIGVAEERFAAVVHLTQPVCTATGTDENKVAEGDTISLSCETTFSGLVAWAPMMNWTHSTVGDIPATNDSSGQLSRYTASVTATMAMHGSQFSCLTYFTEPPPGLIQPDTTTTKYDRRAPVFQQECPTNIVSVDYGVRNIRIGTHSAELIPGQTISCSAVGRPDPQFRWVKEDGAGPSSMTGPILAVTRDMEGNNTYRCEAYNTLVGGRLMSINASTSFTVRIPTTTPAPSTTPSTAPPTTASSTSGPQSPGPISELSDQPLSAGAIAGISVAAILFVGILIALIIYFLCCKRQKKDPGTGMSSKAGVDQVRGPGYTGSSNPVPTDLAYVSGERPPPYTPAGDPRGRNPNQEGIVYADLALDDTPRSRKPIQFMDNTDYADIRRV